MGGARALAYLPAVLAVAEVVQVAIVQVAGSIRGLRAHLAGVDPILLQELAVGDAEGLADGLGDKLGLWEDSKFLHILQSSSSKTYTFKKPQGF